MEYHAVKIIASRSERLKARRNAIWRIIGFLQSLFGLTLLLPLTVSVITDDGLQLCFTISALLLLFGGGVIFYNTQKGSTENLRSRDGFMIVAVIWLSLSLFAALPLLLAQYFSPVSFVWTDAIFEAVSGLTTTGATAFTGLDHFPTSLLFYRQWLQWLGGIGIVVLAVAIMPLLGVGGAQIYKAEAPGPFKEARIAPRISDTAKVLFSVYCGLTFLCFLALWWAGMTPFEAFMHSLTTLATGGFSPYDASIGYFDSNLIKMVITFFMFMGGISFALHYGAIMKGRPIRYMMDEETLTYARYILYFSVVVAFFLYLDGDYNFFDSLIQSTFHVVSFMTSTGYTAADLNEWPIFLTVFLFLIACIGGCQGSSSGGIKVVRIALLTKQGRREIKRLIHPQGEFPVLLNGKFLSDSLLGSVWGFFAVYLISLLFFMGIYLILEHDFTTAFALSATSLNNTGPALGAIGSHFEGIGGLTKMISAFQMILGRLEIFTLLVLLSPHYWRR